jgi:hypothetical protein
LRRTDKPDDKIEIQNIYYGSITFYVIFPYAGAVMVKSWTGITGAIYENANNHADHKKEE